MRMFALLLVAAAQQLMDTPEEEIERTVREAMPEMFIEVPEAWESPRREPSWERRVDG